MAGAGWSAWLNQKARLKRALEILLHSSSMIVVAVPDVNTFCRIISQANPSIGPFVGLLVDRPPVLSRGVADM